MTTALTPNNNRQDLLSRARNGDERAYEALAQHFPETLQTVERVAVNTRRLMLDQITKNDLVTRASLENELESMRCVLGGPNPSLAEQLIIERILACWLNMVMTEQMLITIPPSTIAQDKWLHNRLMVAEKRYLKALTTLARIRRLLKPSVKVNIASQVNVQNNN